ncbi:unnamed protein product [Urochloa humidicola]
MQLQAWVVEPAAIQIHLHFGQGYPLAAHLLVVLNDVKFEPAARCGFSACSKILEFEPADGAWSSCVVAVDSHGIAT